MEKRRRGRPADLAEVVAGHSIGRLQDVWEWVRSGAVPALYMVGEHDAK